MSTETRRFSLRSLVARSIAFYWRSNLAVLAGVAVAVAVLIGSLLVGDSVKGSLRAIALERLGEVRYAVTPGRYIPQSLVDRVDTALADQTATLVPALILDGSARLPGREPVSNVQIVAVPDAFWGLGPGAPAELPSDRGVVLNQTLASALAETSPAGVADGLAPGDAVLVTVGRRRDAPSGSIFGRRSRSDTVEGVRAAIVGIIATEGIGRFTLRPVQEKPRTVYASLAWVQAQLGRAGEINTILVAGTDRLDEALAGALEKAVTLRDYGLNVHASPRGPVLRAEDVVIPSIAVDAFERGRPASVYLANTIAKQGGDAEGIPYSVVACVPDAYGLDEDGIALNAWAAERLSAAVGDTITLAFNRADETGAIDEESHSFRLAAVVPMADAAADTALVPEMQGMTDADRLADLDLPFEIDHGRIGPEDDAYWEEYRTAPKAYLAPSVLRDMWQVKGVDARQNWATAILLPEGTAEDGALESLVAGLPPEQYGLGFRPVRRDALSRAGGSTDFGMLFVSMSFFLVIAAAALVGLLMRLTIERRAAQYGVLVSTGFSSSSAARVLRLEGMVVAAAGVLVGVPLGAGYAWALVWALRNRWQGAVADLDLALHIGPLSILGGAVGGFVVAVLAMLWAARLLRRSQALDLLGGWRALATEPGQRTRLWSFRVAVVMLGLGAVMVPLGLLDAIPATGAFFGGGSALLVGLLALVYARLSRAGSGASDRHLSIVRLAWRGAMRNRVRSALTVGLVACAGFIIVTVAANGRDIRKLDTRRRLSGSGGFSLQVRCDVPVYADIGSEQGRVDVFGRAVADQLPAEATIYALRVNDGDDASCLNMQRPETPRVLGVPSALYAEDRFLAADGDGPPAWSLLEEDLGSVEGEPVVPAFADMSSAQWILKVGVGDEVTVPGLGGRPVRLRIVGLLAPGLFQGELLVGEDAFIRHFGTEGGYRYFLVEVPEAQESATVAALRKGMSDLGATVQRTAEVLAGYARVQNTYLATFRTLGGLGLLLGTFGIVAVLLRGVVERRRELAMLTAVGLRRRALCAMIVVENGLLLILGMLVGGVSALVAVAPHLASSMAKVDWPALATTLGVCAVVGLASCALAASLSMRGNLLSALRSE